LLSHFCMHLHAVIKKADFSIPFSSFPSSFFASIPL
jgi:hypothetical protein